MLIIGEYIANLDKACKGARILVKRRRCKLRKQLVSSAPEIRVADVRNIIIDYCLVDRKVVDTFRSIILRDLRLGADENAFYNSWSTIIKKNGDQFIYIGKNINDPKMCILNIFTFKEMVDIMNGARPIRTDISTEHHIYVRDMNVLLDYICIKHVI